MTDEERAAILDEARQRVAGTWTEPEPRPTVRKSQPVGELLYQERESPPVAFPEAEGEDATRDEPSTPEVMSAEASAAWNRWFEDSLERNLFGREDSVCGHALAEGLALTIRDALRPIEERLAQLEQHARRTDSLDRLIAAAAVALQRFNGSR